MCAVTPTLKLGLRPCFISSQRCVVHYQKFGIFVSKHERLINKPPGQDSIVVRSPEVLNAIGKALEWHVLDKETLQARPRSCLSRSVMPLPLKHSQLMPNTSVR
jgi:hypothetical protein